ncbi:hypothetical protein BDF14DRAFT_1850943 [Spinellus fusiger]|nr:hypothetical protein BDF14DRAFT_1850943 [Spinellus fusiger]
MINAFYIIHVSVLILDTTLGLSASYRLFTYILLMALIVLVKQQSLLLANINNSISASPWSISLFSTAVMILEIWFNT